jgi:uncharacterized iron-regulated protein
MRLRTSTLWIGGGALALAAVIAYGQRPQKAPAPEADCVPVAAWVAPRAAGAERVDPGALLAAAARANVVLLGESHDNLDHHRWQLHTLAALHGARPRMVIGFEMFPRRVQPVLDRWVAGELDEQTFLKAAEWRTVWSFDPALYMPLFHFARMNRIPMLALNVDWGLTRAVSAKGFAAVPVEQREGVTPPAAPTEAYAASLFASWLAHLPPDAAGKEAPKPSRSDPQFLRFVESQQVWDRAMAQGIADARARDPQALVVGIMGSGHVVDGHGVPHQLRDLGVKEIVAFMPWDRGEDCSRLVVGMADAVFGMPEPLGPPAQRARLGVMLERDETGVRIARVEKGSVAEAAGLRAGDVIAEAAGVSVKQAGDLTELVQRQAPGTWLPLKVKRESSSLEVVAKFPPNAAK